MPDQMTGRLLPQKYVRRLASNFVVCEYFGATSIHEPKIKRHDNNKEKAERK
jgi:hypothetical protein